MNFALVCVMSAMSGFISLSQEIVWFRLFSFITSGLPHSFAYVLGTFLCGTACGAFSAGHLEKRLEVRFVGLVMMLAAVMYYFSVPITANAFSWLGYLAIIVGYAFITVVAFLNGLLFPILSHLGIPEGEASGSRLSYIYFWNICGSILGPLVTTFVLMERISLDQIVLIISSFGMISGFIIVWSQAGANSRPWLVSVVVLIVSGAIGVGHGRFFACFYEKFHFGDVYSFNQKFERLIETKSGIVHIIRSHDDHFIYGGGVYDGAFNTNPLHDVNGIQRAYYMATLHRNPNEVLEIGLSSGSWARVFANHSAVKHLTIVEIDRGYHEAISGYPEMSSMFTDPKVEIHFDDGRRWLNQHPTSQYDFILMNNTFAWRSQSTHLLSVEFLELAKRHLKQGGVLYYNTTTSRDAVYTATTVFKHVVAIGSFIAASDHPFDMSLEERRSALTQFSVAGVPVFDPSHSEKLKLLETMARRDHVDVRRSFKPNDRFIVITDDNMATEYKGRFTFYDPARAWWHLWPRQ